MEVSLLLGRIDKDGIFVVTNCSNDAVPAGTRLTKIVKHQVALALPDIHRTVLGKVAAVDLVIQEITLRRWGPPVDVIPEGWSAGLKLTGEGAADLTNIFRAAAKNEQILLQ